jgi:hypothetical protein
MLNGTGHSYFWKRFMKMTCFLSFCHLSNFFPERYQTDHDIGGSDIGLEMAESIIMLDIGLDFLSISNIRHQNI